MSPSGIYFFFISCLARLAYILCFLELSFHVPTAYLPTLDMIGQILLFIKEDKVGWDTTINETIWLGVD